MATVYLARLGGAGGFQRFVAIKRLHPHLAGDVEFIQMFLDEARLAARLHHPNVVPILEIGESPEGYYLVMEYIEGDTLARLLARSAQAGKPLPPKVAIRICLDTLAGLHQAHELTDDDGQPLGIVHRDVSPQNILVGVDGSARITDFGVARATTRLSTTRTGQLKGKLAYMAPEQARGKDIDRRADVFAMGIVVWESLGLKRLFKGEGEADTLNRVLYEPVPKLRTANPTIPSELEAVVMKALEREPDARYATAAEFGDALEKVARSLGILGSSKDLQAQLDAVMGTDISQQRDAVRAWIARSEPSQRMIPGGGGAGASGPNQSITKIEGAASHSQPGSHSGVSSVSSAVIAVAAPPGDLQQTLSAPVKLPVLETLPSRRRSKAWVGIVAVLLLVAVAVPLTIVKLNAGAAHVVSGGAGTTPTTVAPPATTTVAATTATTTTSGVSPGSLPSAPSASNASGPAVTTAHTAGTVHTATGIHTGTRPTATATTTTTATTPPTATATATATGTGIDDLSHNPYR